MRTRDDLSEGEMIDKDKNLEMVNMCHNLRQ